MRGSKSKCRPRMLPPNAPVTRILSPGCAPLRRRGPRGDVCPSSVMLITTDLERIGDLAVNVAERAIDLNQSPPLRPVHDLLKLAELCQKQVRAALDSFVDADAVKAELAIKDDALVDALYHTLFNELLGLMLEDSKNIRRATSLMFVAKHLERLADHATNVAEMVIFMVKGTDVRHPHSRGLA